MSAPQLPPCPRCGAAAAPGVPHRCEAAEHERRCAQRLADADERRAILTWRARRERPPP